MIINLIFIIYNLWNLGPHWLSSPSVLVDAPLCTALLQNFISLYRFEKKGFLNKIRAYICQQTIASLKDGLARDEFVNEENITSPMIRAFDLLFADFLMNQGNLFTLKMFNTEVVVILLSHNTPSSKRMLTLICAYCVFYN